MVFKELHLNHFKGVSEASYKFGSVASVSGRNGLGKTTIADAIYWLLLDKSYSLKANPNIRPIDEEESVPMVTLVMDFDGKDVTISKSQKRKVSKPDENGVQKVTLSNSYTWNDVPVAERDLKEKFKSEGLDLDMIAELSHPDVFTKGLGDKKQRDHMRDTLFKMCSSHTDVDIAKMGTDTSDLAELLEKYSLEEVSAMNKASKKRADDEIKDIPMRIVGLESAKVDATKKAELTAKKEELENKLTEVKNADTSNVVSDMMSKVLELEFEKNELIRKSNEGLVIERKAMADRIFETEIELRKNENLYTSTLNDIEQLKTNIESYSAAVINLQAKWKEVKNSEFTETFDSSVYDISESDKVCPTCGQVLPESKINELVSVASTKKEEAMKVFEKKKEDFEINKKAELDQIVVDGKKNGQLRDEAKDKYERTVQESKNINETVLSIKKKLEDMKKTMDKAPTSTDMTIIPRYNELVSEIESLNKKIEESKNVASDNSVIDEVNAELESVNNSLALINHNSDIDEKIQELRKTQIDYEQAKANAEKILYQIDLFSQRKVSLLTEEINSHFGIVKWVLFDFQKNGSYIETCIPEVDGKRFGDSTNTGREIIAKLDICDSLQKFFGVRIPIILDGAEAINKDNIPHVESQLITLRVSEDNELVVESED